MDGLARVLQEARTKKKLSQRAVEAATGISNAYLSQLESGKVREPSPTMLHKLAELYGLNYSEVLSIAGYPVPNAGKAAPSSRLAARIGPTTQAEEEAIVEYLEFIRSKNPRRHRK